MALANNAATLDPEVLHRSTDERAAQYELPRLDWSTVHPSEHVVQFYETDAFLLTTLTAFIDSGLHAGDAAIVIATPEHREALEAGLQAGGLDVVSARASGQFVVLDAAETLSTFMVDGMPDPARVTDVLGGIIAMAAADWPHLRIFGEMVALLWADGRHAAALQLEALWNMLHETQAFVLFCAYPITGLGGIALAQPLRDMCTAHSRIIPAESYTTLTSPDDRLHTIVRLQHEASLLHAEIAKHEQALRREQAARAEAEQANRLKDEFLATVSHELRTPLTTMLGWSQHLRRRTLNEATLARGLEIIERSAKAQAQLVDDILDVARMLSGTLRLECGAVDLAAVVTAAIDTVQVAADAKNLHLEVTLEPAARQIVGDSSRLQQVVWNLLANAIKFTPAGGLVSVRLERVGNGTQLTVSDTGEGISADVLPYIFERGRQADGTSTRRHGGLGLGLAIVRHLVELHGGTVQAASAGVGTGTTFTIRLPRGDGQENATSDRHTLGSVGSTATEPALPPLAALADLQVLLVDDDRELLEFLTLLLTDAQATVQVATSAAEALEVLQSYTPDVLVSDVAMPEEDGYTLLRKVRAHDEACGTETPAVALTAYAGSADRVRALTSGFNLFVTKPVEPHALITAIAELVAAQRNGARQEGAGLTAGTQPVARRQRTRAAVSSLQ